MSDPFNLGNAMPTFDSKLDYSPFFNDGSAIPGLAISSTTTSFQGPMLSSSIPVNNLATSVIGQHQPPTATSSSPWELTGGFSFETERQKHVAAQQELLRLKQMVTELHKSNTALRAEKAQLDHDHAALLQAIGGRLQQQQPATQHPIFSRPSRADHNATFWAESEYKTYKDAAEERPDMPLRVNDVPVWLEGSDGKPLDKARYKAIRTVMTTNFYDLLHNNLAAGVYTALSQTAVTQLQNNVYPLVPELLYCDGDWKLRALGILAYPDWTRNKVVGEALRGVKVEREGTPALPQGKRESTPTVPVGKRVATPLAAHSRSASLESNNPTRTPPGRITGTPHMASDISCRPVTGKKRATCSPPSTPTEPLIPVSSASRTGAQTTPALPDSNGAPKDPRTDQASVQSVRSVARRTLTFDDPLGGVLTRPGLSAAALAAKDSLPTSSTSTPPAAQAPITTPPTPVHQDSPHASPDAHTPAPVPAPPKAGVVDTDTEGERPRPAQPAAGDPPSTKPTSQAEPVAVPVPTSDWPTAPPAGPASAALSLFALGEQTAAEVQKGLLVNVADAVPDKKKRGKAKATARAGTSSAKPRARAAAFVMPPEDTTKPKELCKRAWAISKEAEGMELRTLVTAHFEAYWKSLTKPQKAEWRKVANSKKKANGGTMVDDADASADDMDVDDN